MKHIGKKAASESRRLAPRHLRAWSPELRRAMISVRPDYFRWGVERREHYGVAMPGRDAASLDKALLRELFGKVYRTRKETAAAVRQLSLAEQDRWNEAVLPLHGIGEDLFYLNESLARNKSILEFETLKDLDEFDYRFQEEARRKEDGDYLGKPYRGSLYLSWARLLVDGSFAYATLSMAAGYIFAQLSDTSHALLAELIPHRYVPGKHHGKAEGRGYQWDMRVDANGQEGIFDELRRQIWRYEQERYDAMLTSWEIANRSGVYLIDCSEPREVHWHFVFTDPRALSAVRFRSFLRDCRAAERPSDELVREADREKAAFEQYIDDQYDHVKRTYDPKVRRFHKRRKIVIAKGAFDLLE